MKNPKIISLLALFFFGLQALCPLTLRASDFLSSGIESATGAINGAVNGLGKNWEGARQQYGYAAPLAMIGTLTNPVMERFTGVQAGSVGAREWGKGVYQWTGGLFNVPMVVVFGKSLSNTYSNDSMSLGDRGQYLKDHPLEVLEYGAAIFGGAGLLSGGAGALTGSLRSLRVGIEGVRAAQGAAKLIQVASMVYGPLAAASTPILAYGVPLGLGAYEWNKVTGTYKTGGDGNIVDSFGRPQVVDGFSALMYSFGAKAEHIISGDPNAEAFSNGMAGQSVSVNLSRLSKGISTNSDGTRNWAGTAVSIPLVALSAPFGFAEFPLSFGDNVGNAQRQGWSEGLAEGDLVKGFMNSSIYTGQAVGGSALGMYSFAGDIFIVGPVNFADNLRGGDGRVLKANWLGETVANAPGIDRLGLGKYFNPVNPAEAEYPNIDFTIANAPFMFNLRSSVLGEKGAAGKPGYLGKVEAFKSIVLKPVDFLTSPMNNAFERVGNIITGQGSVPVPPSVLGKPPKGSGMTGVRDLFLRGLKYEQERSSFSVKDLNSKEINELADQLAKAGYDQHVQVMNDYLKAKGLELDAGAIIPQIMGGLTEQQKKAASSAPLKQSEIDALTAKVLDKNSDHDTRYAALRALGLDAFHNNNLLSDKNVRLILSKLPLQDKVLRGVAFGFHRATIERVVDPVVSGLISKIRASSIRPDNVDLWSDLKQHIGLLILASCSTGAPGDNLKDPFSKAIEAETAAPNDDCNGIQLSYDAKKLSGITFSVRKPDGSGYTLQEHKIKSQTQAGKSKHAVIVFPQADYNGAFDESNWLFSQIKSFKDNDYQVSFTRVDNEKDARQFVLDHVGPEKIVLMLGAHGTPWEMRWGKVPNPTSEINQLYDKVAAYLEHNNEAYTPDVLSSIKSALDRTKEASQVWDRYDDGTAMNAMETYFARLKSSLDNVIYFKPDSVSNLKGAFNGQAGVPSSVADMKVVNSLLTKAQNEGITRKEFSGMEKTIMSLNQYSAKLN